VVNVVAVVDDKGDAPVVGWGDADRHRRLAAPVARSAELHRVVRDRLDDHGDVLARADSTVLALEYRLDDQAGAGAAER
jgi:hypothetical protein